MRKYLCLLVMLSTYCLAGFAQSQTRTATFLNDLYNFQQVYGNQNYPRARAQDVAANDNIYTCTSKLTSEKDSGWTRSTALSTLALQGFGFTIPDEATIENIVLKVRRFKKGTPSVGDHILSLMQRFEQRPGLPGQYGAMWTFMDDEELDYPGRIYPATETEYLFSQRGSGNNGGGYHDQDYEWTPAIVNAITFGVRIMNYHPIGKGTVQICYDLVEVTVEYSESATKAARSSATAEAKPLKEPIIYPNPFTTKTNIQFTASESGRAIVELYNITGTKIRTLFSGNVEQGQVHNAAAGDASLPKGIYVYTITNGKQKHTGRIIKLE
ncbi:MAG TPA: T9SS type A sorting domain-containing protein [Chitinophagaceae bacterium]|nr:T9SS type A sorting domain-containing protein [Chitinophagaceae bacterium]